MLPLRTESAMDKLARTSRKVKFLHWCLNVKQQSRDSSQRLIAVTPADANYTIQQTIPNELPVIGSLCLRKDFWDRHGANCASC